MLPNFGVVYRPAEGHQVYFSYAETLSAPRTDDLYSGVQPDDIQSSVQPENAQNYDIGYRYTNDNILFSAGAFFNQFDNFIVRINAKTDHTTLPGQFPPVRTKAIVHIHDRNSAR